MSMFRARPMEDPIEKEKREIENRRARDANRLPRLLHAKTRLFGVDTQALQQQVAEKQEKERLDIERDLYYDDLGSTFARALGEHDTTRKVNRKQEEMELRRFREMQQRERIRREQVERVAGDELLDVPTDFLRFGGQDDNNAYRTRAQKLQQQDWLAQQIETLQAREARDRAEQDDYDAMQDKILDIQNAQQGQAELARANARREMVAYNKQMAMQKAAREARLRESNQRLDDAELTQTLNSGLLNEANSYGKSNFKGFTTEQRQEILDEQKAQQDEKRYRRAMEEREEEAYAQQQEDFRRMRMLADRKKTALEKQERANVARAQVRQAKEHTLRLDYLDNVVYTNPAQPSYFEQFGTSCR